MEKEKKSITQRFKNLSIGGKIIFIMITLLLIMVVVGFVIDNMNNNKSIVSSSEQLESESKTNKENMKSFVEKSNTITGMNFAFTKEEFSEKYLKNYQEEIEIGLVDKGFTYQQTQENLKIYANSLYRAKGNAIGRGKEEHFIVMLLEEPTNNKIVRVMGSIINFSSQNEKLQQTSINGIINMYKAIDESITEEKAKSIIKDISGKIKNNGQPAIYENGILYSAEEYTNNGYKYTRFSATAVTKEKAKEIYGVEF